MKRIFLTCVGIVLVTGICFGAETGKGVASTKEGYGAAGCGLGSLVFGNEPGFVQVFAATTNGTFGSQTFGITTGTSNCEKQARFASNERLHEFVRVNMDNVAKDIARGEGEYLKTLVELLDIPVGEREETYKKLQNNFGNIFASDDVDVADVVDSIIVIING